MFDGCRKLSEIRLYSTVPNETVGDTVAVEGFQFCVVVLFHSFHESDNITASLDVDACGVVQNMCMAGKAIHKDARYICM
jgi:hypothetical protein